MQILSKEFIDLIGTGFIVFAKVSEAAVSYTIFEVLGKDDETDLPLFEVKRSLDRIEQTTDLVNAAIFAYGRVEWDGYSDWHFDAQDDCMIHGCDQEDIERIGKILLACWDWTAELIPEKWSPD